MPPRNKISKEMILNAAKKFITAKDASSLNIRSLASAIGCSTQPIYSCFPNGREEIINEILSGGREDPITSILKATDKDNFLPSFAISYINFAILSKSSFNQVFINDPEFLNKIIEKIKIAIPNDKLLGKVGSRYGLSENTTDEIFKRVFVFIHGLAVLVSTKSLKMTNSEVENMVSDTTGDIARAMMLRATL